MSPRCRPDDFTIEESAVLLHAIFPDYPDTHEMKPVPESGAFLQVLRAGKLRETRSE